MTQNERFDNQTDLDICEADKKDLQDEVKHLKESIKFKNQEIGFLRSKLRSSETQMAELQSFLLSQVSALTSKLTHPSFPEQHQPTINNDYIPCSVHLSDQDANHEPPPALPSLPTSSTQTSQNTNAKRAVIPASQHPVPSSSAEPEEKLARSICTTASFSDEEYECPPVKKSKFDCENCVETFSTVRELSYHMYHNHGDIDSSDDEDPFAIIKNINNKQPMKPKKENLKAARQGQAACPKCKKVMLKGNLVRHIKGCKEKTEAVNKRIVREEEDTFHVLTEEVPEEVFLNPLFVEMITFVLRSTSASDDGVSLNMNIDIPAYLPVREVMTRFSKKLLVPMDRLLMRCNGRELGVEEEVRGLANQTVWLTEIGVKNENI